MITFVQDARGEILRNTYEIHHAPDTNIALINPSATFQDVTTTYEGRVVTIPAPDPRLLALHAACAQIAHMSGAAEHLEEFYRDTDPIAVMTEPNAAQELTRVLTSLQVVSATA